MTLPALSPATRRLIAAGLVIVAAYFLYSVRELLPPFVLALLVAYILGPVVDALARGTRWPRAICVLIAYITAFVAIVVPFMLLVPALVREVAEVDIDLQRTAAWFRRYVPDEDALTAFGVSLSPAQLVAQLQGAFQAVLSYLTARTASILFGVLEGVAWLVLILFVAFYLLKDAPAISRWFQASLAPEYRDHVMGTLGEVNTVFGTYLRGQLVLMASVGVVTTLALLAVRLDNALVLGVLAGLLEIVPMVGPIIAAVPPVLVALVQPDTPFNMSNVTYALLIAGIYVLIQQLENNVLVPQIIGRSVNLHPVVIIFAALAGANLAGLLGVFLAAPVAASIRIVLKRLWPVLTGVQPVPAEPAPAPRRPRLRSLRSFIVRRRGTSPG